MATIRNYFDNDFKKTIIVQSPSELATEDGTIVIEARTHLNPWSRAAHLSFFVPSSSLAVDACIKIIEESEYFLRFETRSPNTTITLPDGAVAGDQILFEVQDGKYSLKYSSLSDEPIRVNDLTFTRQIYFYTEDRIDDALSDIIKTRGKAHNLFVQVRGPIYAMERTAIEKPHAFICHDSRDKDEIARPLAEGLQKLTHSVWYDEYSLKPGDRLRESIERGLKECKKCILVLTPNFLSNQGWTKTEFNSIFTREILDNAQLVVPIWHRIEKRDVYEYSPSLLNVVGLHWSRGLDEVVRQIAATIAA